MVALSWAQTPTAAHVCTLAHDSAIYAAFSVSETVFLHVWNAALRLQGIHEKARYVRFLLTRDLQLVAANLHSHC